ncbi:hypothetical protein [Nocardia cyriacigeorgica]|uniref:hypothetical protein n=1 Tax=Nocardia cyriacigeorgica TaxID=135487 RepID=UPI001895338A|nr:hypothetical protein [Nocardia cyriacigeorgica]MBF6496714.1 hypothetical protein [Nocardia cyriacigeorgica]
MGFAPSPRRTAVAVTLIGTAIAFIGIGGIRLAGAESVVGVDQNLGYALLWPVFGGFLVFALLRSRQWEQSAPSSPSEAPDDRLAPPVVARRPEYVSHGDRELADYNRYLARLHAEDMRARLEAAGLDLR